MSTVQYLEAPVGDLRPNPFNPNRVSAENEMKIRASIERNGIFKPIIVRQVAGVAGYEIIGGQHRWEQAKELGFTHVPVANLGLLSDVRAKEIGLLDNARYGVDDTLSLGAILKEIGDADEIQSFLPYGDTDLTAIWSAQSIDLDDLNVSEDDLKIEAEKPEDQAPAPKPTKTHTVMRFKIGLADAERVTKLIAATQKSQGLTTEQNSITYSTFESGEYTFQIVAVSYTDLTSDPLVGTATVIGVNSIEMGMVSDLVNAATLEGGNTTFTGRDFRLSWRNMMRVSSVTGTEDEIEEVESDNAVYSHTTLEFFHGATKVRTQRVTGNSFIYTYDMNREDGLAAGNSGPSRSVTVEARVVDHSGRFSPPTAITLSNPASAAITPAVMVRETTLTISWPAVEDADHVGYLVWVLPTSGAVAGVAPTAIVTDNQFRFTGQRNTTYWISVASYDAFGKAALTYSSPLSATTTFNGADLDPEVFDGLDPIGFGDVLPATGELDELFFLRPENRLYRWSGTAWVTATPDEFSWDDFPEDARPLRAVDVLPTTGELGELVVLNSDNRIYRWDGSTWVPNAPGEVDLDSFPPHLRPIEVVDVLPTTGNFEGRVVMLTTDGQLHRYHNGAWTRNVPAQAITGEIVANQIANGVINIAKFASGLRPVEIVSALPGTPHVQGRMVLLTTDNKMYRNTGSGWTSAVPAADIAGQVAAAQIAALEASKITGQLSNAQISALEAAKLTGQITAPQIADSAITDAKIAGLAASKITGQMTDAQIGEVAAAKLTGQVVSAQITDAAITVAKFASGLRPVEIVSSLPTSGNFAGRTVFLTSDSKLYRHTGSPSGAAGFTTATPSTDITGQLTDAQIAAVAAAKLTGQITGPQIADGAVSDAKVAALAASKITGQLSNAQIAAVAAAKLTGTIVAAQIANGAVTDAKIAGLAASKVTGQLSDTQIAAVSAAKMTGQIVATQITDNAITTAKIAANAVVADSIASNAVIAAKIATNAVTAAKINAGAVTTAKVAAGAIEAEKIAAGAVIADKIAAGAVIAGKIAANAVTATEIAAGTITASEIASNAITAVKINAGAVETAKIATGAVQADKIAAGAVIAGKVAANAIEATNIAANAVTTAKIAAGAVTATEIASNAVTAVKISAGAVEAAKIAAGAVVADKIAAGAVTAGKVAANAITATEIASGTITATQIASGTITGNRLVANTITATQIATGTITATQIASGTITGNRIAANTITGAQIAANTITANEIAATTITAAQIASNAITSAKIAAGAVTATEIAAGAITASKLAIGDFTNLVLNSALDNLDGWDVDSQIDGVVNAPSNMSSRRAVQIPDTVTSNRYIRWETDVTEGKSYLMSAEIRGSGSSPIRFDFRHYVQWYDRAGTNFANSSGPTQTRTNTTAVFTTYSAQAPAGAVRARFIFGRLSSGTQSNPGYIGSPVVRVMGDGELIVDGSITTNHMTVGSINGNRISANTITATQIAANTITATQIAAATITGAQIVANTITATQIAATTITAAQIAAGTITGDRIAAATITGNRIAANTITATQIAAGTITASEIASGTITADRMNVGTVRAALISTNALQAENIAAGAITASRLNIGDATNVYPDYDMRDPDFYSSDGAAYTLSNVTNSAVGDRELRLNANGEAYTGWCSIDGDAALRVRAVTRNGTADSGRVGTVFIEFGSYNSGNITITRRVQVHRRSNSTSYSANEINETATVAEDRFRFVLVRSGSTTGSYVTMAGLRVRKRMTGELIVDGSIVTNHMTAGSIHGNRISSNTITATQIAANTITATQIAANTITAAEVTTGELITSAAQIRNAIITNAKITGAIQSDNFSSGNTGWQINKSGAAQFNSLIVRDSLVVGSVSEIKKWESLGEQRRINTSWNTAGTISLGPVVSGEVWTVLWNMNFRTLHGPQPEGKTSPSEARAEYRTQRRLMENGVWLGWETIYHVWSYDYPQSWLRGTGDAHLFFGIYDDVEYRLQWRSTSAPSDILPGNNFKNRTLLARKIER